MKKISLAIFAFAALLIASCGGNGAKSTDAEAVDSTKTFEQSQIEAKIKVELDSIAAKLNEKDVVGLRHSIDEGKIVLTADEKKVKPDYLLQPSVAKDAVTASQKYQTIAMLWTDKAVAKLYDMNTDEYDVAISELAVGDNGVNDPALKKVMEAEDQKAALKQLSKDMDEEGRINFFWAGSAAAVVENLYIMTQNTEKFVNGYNDEQVADITFRLICIIDALDRLTQYDYNIIGIAEGLEPLKNLNATTVEEFKKQLEESKEAIKASRESFLK